MIERCRVFCIYHRDGLQQLPYYLHRQDIEWFWNRRWVILIQFIHDYFDGSVLPDDLTDRVSSPKTGCIKRAANYTHVVITQRIENEFFSLVSDACVFKG